MILLLQRFKVNLLIQLNWKRNLFQWKKFGWEKTMGFESPPEDTAL